MKEKQLRSDLAKILKRFTNFMCRGNVDSTIKLLSSNMENTKILLLNDETVKILK